MASSREKRANAGSKMAQLLNEEEEDEFYKTTYGGFEDEEDDKEYSSNDVSEVSESEETDSDFSNNESDELISDDGDDEVKRKKPKVTYKTNEPKNKAPIKSLPFGEGTSGVKAVHPKQISPEKKTSSVDEKAASTEGTPVTPKTNRRPCMRQSTALKSAEMRERAKALEEMKQKRLSEPKKNQETRPLTQAELLEEAKKTEIINMKSLESYERMELEKKKKLKTVKHINDGGPKIRYHSIVMPLIEEVRRGTQPGIPFESVKFGRCSRNFVTFTDEKTVREIFPQNKPKPTQRSVGPVSQLPARYFDPVTQLPYYNVQEFKILRQAYYQQLEKKGNSNDPEVAAWLEWRKQNK